MKVLTILQATALAFLAIFGAFAAQGQAQSIPPKAACIQQETGAPCDL